MNRKRIVLADDHAIVRAGIRDALQEIAELEVVGEVGDGHELLSVLAKTQPDCLLIDVTMPEFNPFEAMTEIRRAYPSLRILVVSAYDDDVYVQGLLSVGVDGYHLKDQSLDDLRLAVRRVLDGERWITSRLVSKLIGSSSHASSGPIVLSGRQRSILRLLQQGLDNQTIAMRLGISVKTIEHHLTRLYQRLGAQSRLEAVNYANRHPELLVDTRPPPYMAEVQTEKTVLARLHVLLVDDNPRYRTQLGHMILGACPNAALQEAEGIGRAVALAAQTSPDIAFVDVVLGDESGITCTRRLHAQCSQTRVVLLSAYPDREFHRLGLEAGALAFIDKQDLSTAVLRHILEDIAVRGLSHT